MKNPFELFGLEPQFLVDHDALSATFRRLLQAVHPDRFASSSEQEQRMAMQKSTDLNQAYRVLKDPIQRAQAILALTIGDVAKKEVTVNDPDFLMEQLELREMLDTIIRTKDITALMAFSDKIEKMANEQELVIAKMFTANDNKPDCILSEVHKLQFMSKTLSDIADAEDDILG